MWHTVVADIDYSNYGAYEEEPEYIVDWNTLGEHQYIIPAHSPVSWYVAREWCMLHGADLASIHSQEEASFIQTEVDQRDVSNGILPTRLRILKVVAGKGCAAIGPWGGEGTCTFSNFSILSVFLVFAHCNVPPTFKFLAQP